MCLASFLSKLSIADFLLNNQSEQRKLHINLETKWARKLLNGLLKMSENEQLIGIEWLKRRLTEYKIVLY